MNTVTLPESFQSYQLHSPLRNARMRQVIELVYFIEKEGIGDHPDWDQLHDDTFKVYRRCFGMRRSEVLTAVDDACRLGFTQVTSGMRVELTGAGRKLAHELEQGEIPARTLSKE